MYQTVPYFMNQTVSNYQEEIAAAAMSDLRDYFKETKFPEPSKRLTKITSFKNTQLSNNNKNTHANPGSNQLKNNLIVTIEKLKTQMLATKQFQKSKHQHNIITTSAGEQNLKQRHQSITNAFKN